MEECKQAECKQRMVTVMDTWFGGKTEEKIPLAKPVPIWKDATGKDFGSRMENCGLDVSISGEGRALRSASLSLCGVEPICRETCYCSCV
jgi:hypothetical protein